MSHQDELRRLIGIRQRRLQKLKEQLAFQGSAADPKITMEIEDTEAEIETLQTQLVEGGSAVPLAVPNLDAADEPPPAFKGVRVGEVQVLGCALRNFVIALSTLLATFGLGSMLLLTQLGGGGTAVPADNVTPSVVAVVSPTPNPTATNRPVAATEEVMAEEPEDAFDLIAFAAGVTEDFEPVEPLFEFTEGITQVHVIFEYEGLSPELTWSQTFYVGSEVISRPPQPWPGDEAGLFDFVIELDGEPLPPGEWFVEFYVEGELVLEGLFYIEPIEPKPTPTAEETPPE